MDERMEGGRDRREREGLAVEGKKGGMEGEAERWRE